MLTLDSAEVLWSQKFSSSSPGRQAVANTICYCCGDKGHYARNCSEQSTAKCTFCQRRGHMEIVCRQKSKSMEEEAAAGAASAFNNGEVSFFHGRPAECNVITFGRSTTFTETLHYTPSESGLRRMDVSLIRSAIMTAAASVNEESRLRGRSPSQEWLCDTGASHHVCNDKSRFKTVQCLKVPLSMETFGDISVVTHTGTVEIEVDGDNGKQFMTLTNVILVEGSKFNIFSLQQTRMRDFFYGFDNKDNGKIQLLMTMTTRSTRQLAMFSETRGRWTLDATFPDRDATSIPPLTPSAKVTGDKALYYKTLNELSLELAQAKTDIQQMQLALHLADRSGDLKLSKETTPTGLSEGFLGPSSRPVDLRPSLSTKSQVCHATYAENHAFLVDAHIRGSVNSSQRLEDALNGANVETHGMSCSRPQVKDFKGSEGMVSTTAA